MFLTEVGNVIGKESDKVYVSTDVGESWQALYQLVLVSINFFLKCPFSQDISFQKQSDYIQSIFCRVVLNQNASFSSANWICLENFVL